MGDARHRPQRHRGAGARHGADGARSPSTAGSCIRSGCRTTGAETVWYQAIPRTICLHSALDANVHIMETKASTADIIAGRRPRGPALRALVQEYQTAGRQSRGKRARDDRSTDPAAASGWLDHPPRMGFLTDTSLCIGCKACEVACKQWNSVPEDGLNLLGSSYDNTGGLGASTWRHVAFIEQHGG